MMYNDNKYFYYTRKRIMTTNISLYKKSIIKYLMSLYKKTYNDIKYFIIQEDV